MPVTVAATTVNTGAITLTDAAAPSTTAASVASIECLGWVLLSCTHLAYNSSMLHNQMVESVVNSVYILSIA